MSATVKSADRVLRILELLTEHRDGLTLADIQKALELPKSSAHALVNTMAARGFLHQDPESRKFTVGIRLWQAGQSYLAASSLEHAALPFMTKVRDELNETVQLATIDGTDNVYLAKVDADQQLRLASHVGARLPAYATGVGKAILSRLSDDEIQALYRDVEFARFTKRTIASIDQLLAELQQSRERGYAEDHGEYTEGVFCIAVPLRLSDDHQSAAISVSIPDVRKSADLSKRTLASLLRAADEISQRFQ